jgi:hypothetical protein
VAGLDRRIVCLCGGREAAAYAGLGSGPTELGADARLSPRSRARRAVDDAEQRTHGEFEPPGDPRVQVLPAPVVHPDLAAAAALTVPDEQRPAARIEVALVQVERFLDPQPGTQSNTIKARRRAPWTLPPAWHMTATISSTRGGSAG